MREKSPKYAKNMQKMVNYADEYAEKRQICGNMRAYADFKILKTTQNIVL